MKKKFLSMLLSIAVVLTTVNLPMLATNVYAEETSQDSKVGYCDGSEFVAHAYSEESEYDYTNEELFEIYAAKTLGLKSDEVPATRLSYVGEHLTGLNKEIYDILKSEIINIANGRRDNAIVEIGLPDIVDYFNLHYTKEDLGLDTLLDGENFSEDANTAIKKKWTEQVNAAFSIEKVNDALLADCPYELYWYLKTTGVYTSYGFGYSGNSNELDITPERTSITFLFTVDSNFRSGIGEKPQFSVNTTKTGATATAVTNAKTIVTAASSLSDYEKLVKYRNEICDRVTYDHTAASKKPEDNESGIAPWQLINVFDDNSDTNVVCEGYSKAFAYLCELTSFNSSSIKAYTVSGQMDGGTGAGPHMWNVVQMDDGKNYLVDVTNCDEGTSGAPDKLFLRGYGAGANKTDPYAATDEQGGFTTIKHDIVVDPTDPDPATIVYYYDRETIASYLKSELEINSGDYVSLPAATITTMPTAKTGLVYTGAAQALLNSDGVATGGTLVYSLTETGTYSATIPSGTNAGTYTVWVKVKGDSSHADSAPAKIENITIGKASAGLTVASPINKTFGDAPFTISPTRSGDGVLSYSSSNTAVATVDNTGKVTLSGVGSTVITVSLAESANYSADSKTVTINVSKGTHTDTVVYEKEYPYTVLIDDAINLSELIPADAGNATYVLKSQEPTGAETVLSAAIAVNKLTYTVTPMETFADGVYTTITVTVSSDNYTAYDKVIKLIRTKCAHPAESIEVVHIETATCEGAGKDQKKCSVCGVITEDNVVVPALGHKWNADFTIDKAATCGEAGSKSIYCSVCGKNKDITEIPALSHEWDDGVVTKESTFTEKGIKTFTCKNDKNHKMEVSIPTLEAMGDVVAEDLEVFTEEDLTKNEIHVVGVTDAEYTGNAVTFDIRVYKGNKLLREGTDYSIKYENNKAAYTNEPSANAPTVIVTGKGANADINKSVPFKILPVSLKDNERVCVSNEVVVAGSGTTPIPSVTIDGKKLKYSVDYALINTAANRDSLSKAGSFEASVIGIGNYAGQVEFKVTVVDGNIDYLMMSAAKVSGFAKTLKYMDGKPVEQNLSNLVVKVGKEKLSPSDYTVSYVNNKKIGTASMIIRAAEGSSKFCGEKIVTYKISGIPISKAKATYDKNQIYSGKTVKPAVSLRLSDGTVLNEGTDYTISYAKNVNAGTASIIINGMGIYTGTAKKTFKIKALELTNSQITVSAVQSSIKQENGFVTYDVEVKNGGKLLTKDIDYTVKYKKIKGSNVLTAVIKGKGNYTKSVSFSGPSN